MNNPKTNAPLLRPALTLFVLLAALTGAVYPLAVTGVAQAAFPQQAHGSLLMKDGRVIGSSLIGQHFSDPKYFWGRPSATAPRPYDATASGGSNQGPLNPALAEAVRSRIAALRAADPGSTAPLPADLVTASASGLDPHISPAGARWQAARVAQARALAPAQVEALIAQHTEGATLFGLMGEPRVNVLALNLALDALAKP
ncbi:potassium-transporting ATPase subunit KdpC [Xenophilus arseniciresistens]|uniref:Potassium-transporting ATPase KdpC subunit n=1 Tax=Xenophilus arseniciresistens TaxID=1283306 RepID=A0AAE3NCQ0_9BURK|nr:potassium-transporting ATPase subunit KdpC [Xenophilus arseniciresistens]MDA7419251.1 potassium-transporting ATPase subunit KdpC [Xenophilus arseniciresistens]